MISHHEELKANMTHVIVVQLSTCTYGFKKEDKKEDIKKIKFRCDTCDIEVISQAMLARHNKSAMHKRKLQ